MTGAGFRAVTLPRPLPTPLLAFAIRDLGCVAGVMVTASHNPPQDNGYKVYLGDGSQIVPPADTEIAERIAAVGALADVPRGGRRRRSSASEIVDRYLDTVAELAGDGPRDLVIVYTPLHGVGGTAVAQALETAGFAAPHVVERAGGARPGLPHRRLPQPGGAGRDGPRDGARRARSAPTSWWPTTPTPTAAPSRCPARTAGGCCAATRSGRCSATTCSSRGARAPTPPRSSPRRCWARWRRPPGSRYAETLTGFKWIGRVEGLAFGYEEALGYCVDPEHVQDKDGVSALVLVCELAAARQGRGPHACATCSTTSPASTGCTPPTSSRCGSTTSPRSRRRWTGCATTPPDLARRARRRAASTTSRWAATHLPPTDGLRYRLADGARVIVRPSRHRAEDQVLPRGRRPGGRRPEDGVDAARISAAGRLDAIRRRPPGRRRALRPATRPVPRSSAPSRRRHVDPGTIGVPDAELR